MYNETCDKCGMGCETPCEAVKQLQEIYKATRIKERHQLIKKYGRSLGTVDAEPNKDLRRLAEIIINKFPRFQIIPEYDIRVGYVMSQEKPPGTKTKYADCTKVKLKYQAWLPFDFIITFYEPNTEILSENQRRILMLHELRHIGIGEKGLRLVEHEIEDFEGILREYGIKWNYYGEEVPDILSEDNILLNEGE